ncbi:hypothetical protein Vi05172_g3768 [Venturia inaequalis]|nr:hypothetical protein Vi05172_g3768 [Venturia inaequalis]
MNLACAADAASGTQEPLKEIRMLDIQCKELE